MTIEEEVFSSLKVVEYKIIDLNRAEPRLGNRTLDKC